jgi:acetyl/propionyl-CoA carboxylase alpha subunit
VALEDDVSGVEAIGFPVMLKAAAGGGGRGMRRVDRPEDLRASIDAARREAIAAFGDGEVYVERLVSPTRHVEVQLLGDRHGGLAVLGERDCSVQRRHQKLVEESPSPAVNATIREALFDSARRVARTVDFHNAATVEFLLDAEGNHYFLEMNTRLQVEHGVTELVTGLDLVAWQIRVAAGERLPTEVLEAPPRGHAIEVRIYAEDPYDGFRPTTGRVGAWVMPEGPGIRVDGGMEPDTDLRPEYDPLLAKLMVHADDRAAAVARLRRALDETLIGGVQTDAGFLRWLVDDASFSSGRYDTSLITDRWGAGPAIPDDVRELVARAAMAGRARSGAATASAASSPRTSAWGRRAREEALRR